MTAPLCSAGSDGAGSLHWRVVPWEAGGGRVLVWDEPLPGNWSYFEVLFAGVNLVAVSPVAGEMEELKTIYRLPGS